MNKRILLSLSLGVALSGLVSAEVLFNGPPMILADENCIPIAGVSASTSEAKAMEKASRRPNGTYCVIRPNATIIVNNIAVTIPDPDPLPPTDPIPDPDPVASCVANADPSNYLSALSNAVAGDVVCLSDGIYTNRLIVPSDVTVMSENRLGAEIIGDSSHPDWQPVLRMDGNNSVVDGLYVHHAVSYGVNTCGVGGTNNTMINSICAHASSYKHSIPIAIGGSGHLISNNSFFGKGRYLLMCYEADNLTIRQNIGRWDSTTPNEPNEPNATFSNYSCNNTIWENNISLDYGKPVTPMVHCGDFCMSTTFTKPNLNVKYFGNIVINHDFDTSNNTAFRADQKSSTNSDGLLVKDMYISQVRLGIVIKKDYQNPAVENCTTGTGLIFDYGFGDGKAKTCTDDADITVRYVDGIKTNEPLFPFSNEDLIKSKMCATGERQSNWCNYSGTLSEYITSF